MTTLQQDVESVQAGIFALQAADNQVDDCEVLDTVSKGRGAASDCDYTLLEIANMVGLGDSAYPAQNVKKVLKKAEKKFVRNYIFMLIHQSAMNVGMDNSEAIDFACQSYSLSALSGMSDIDILRGWLDD